MYRSLLQSLLKFIVAYCWLIVYIVTIIHIRSSAFCWNGTTLRAITESRQAASPFNASTAFALSIRFKWIEYNVVLLVANKRPCCNLQLIICDNVLIILHFWRFLIIAMHQNDYRHKYEVALRSLHTSTDATYISAENSIQIINLFLIDNIKLVEMRNIFPGI